MPLGTRKLELARQLATTALRGRRPQRTSLNQENHNKSPEWGPRRDRRCCASHGPFDAKTVSDRAPGEIHPFQLIVETEYFLLRRGARTLRVFYWPAGCNLHGPRAGIISVARWDFISIVLSHNERNPS